MKQKIVKSIPLILNNQKQIVGLKDKYGLILRIFRHSIYGVLLFISGL